MKKKRDFRYFILCALVFTYFILKAVDNFIEILILNYVEAGLFLIGAGVIVSYIFEFIFEGKENEIK